MTKRYIDAERLKDSMFAYYDCLEESANGRPYKGDTLMDYEVVDMIEDCIDNAPTADVVEVKHEEWIIEKHNVFTLSHGYRGTKIIYTCPFCDYHFKKNMNFCGHCGAKMDGGKINGNL